MLSYSAVFISVPLQNLPRVEGWTDTERHSTPSGKDHMEIGMITLSILHKADILITFQSDTLDTILLEGDMDVVGADTEVHGVSLILHSVLLTESVNIGLTRSAHLNVTQ